MRKSDYGDLRVVLHRTSVEERPAGQEEWYPRSPEPDLRKEEGVVLRGQTSETRTPESSVSTGVGSDEKT